MLRKEREGSIDDEEEKLARVRVTRDDTRCMKCRREFR